ncbi:hypothetical protein PSHT_15173 [Puccinia striiformis]|uniref:Integrase catalytic domain-containing protein n=1 Tax=Puccinia striiformis TaxID=27350 RepID=A0A2S4UGE9_9BASI|nr:hypothetical protein PSHT_15173 [Puccinia striiformis]
MSSSTPAANSKRRSNSQNLDALPPSPEVTGNSTLKKPKASTSERPDHANVEKRQAPPHLSTQTHGPSPANAITPQVSSRRATEKTEQEIRAAVIEKEMVDYEEAEFHLKQTKLVLATIQAANSQFRSDNVLKADGSNFGDWYRNLSDVGGACLTGSHFFFNKCNNNTFERIGPAVMINSIHRSLAAEMQSLQTCFEMYKTLRGKFKTTSRAAQMNIWYKFRAFKIDPNGHNAGISATLRDLNTEWISINVVFNKDAFMGFILQSAVMESTAPYKAIFEQRVEDLVQADRRGGCPPFDSIMKALDICKEQYRNLAEISSFGNNLASAHPPSTLATSVADEENFDISAYLADVNEEEWVDALDFFAITSNKCWQCDDVNHYARNCPDKSRVGAGSKPRGQPLGTIVGTIYGYLPSGFPVNSSRFPRMTTRKTLTPPSKSQEQARNLADYYRPRYQQSNRQSHSVTPQVSQQGGVSAQLVEAGDVPDDLDGLEFHNMALGENVVSNVAVFDTGASHGFTGSKFFLHDFRTLSKPIGVSVATNGAGSYITGMGNLRFQAPDGRIIVIRQVLYCEQAKTTLILMAALRKANALVAYDNNTDTFQITRPNGEHLFDCPFEPSKNRWCMPYPMIRSDVVQSYPIKNCSVLFSHIPTDRPSSTPIFSSVSSLSRVSPTVHPSFPFSHSQPQFSLATLPMSHASNASGSPAVSSSPSMLSQPVGNSISMFASKAKASPPPMVFPEPLGKATNYQWKPEVLTKDEVKLLYYHRAFGHASLRHIRKIIKHQLGNGLPDEIPSGKIHCPVCAISKSTQVNPLAPTLRNIERLDVMAADLIGPFQVDSIDGGKYLLTMRDVATGYAFAKVLKHKNDANGHIIDIITRLEQVTGKRVGTLRSDNGGEFANQALFDFLASKGIAAEKSLPYHHYQNGMIERFNRTIADMGRTILIDSPLPKEFWSYAFIWAAHVLNRLPNSASGDKTPFEALFDKKPQFDHFRVFGSTGYIHIPH